VERRVTASARTVLAGEVVVTFVLYALLWAVSLSQPRVAVSVFPHVLPYDAALRMTCTVPRDAENRWLQYGLGNDDVSGRQLDGDKAPSVWTVFVPHVPCASTVWCAVTTNAGRTYMASTAILVSGCDAQ
jgi:hypothetical protein